MATITAVRPDSRFGTLSIGQDNVVSSFAEKRQEDVGWINGGYMVLENEILNHIPRDSTILEKEPLEYAANSNNLVAFMHHGFWACMDTMRDKQYLETLCIHNNAPWQIWK
jgi:glucose-1-phosphate cytidylyltransferase